jgi:MFS family permease
MTTATHAPATSRWYPSYALGVLFVVYVFNFIDRSILHPRRAHRAGPRPLRRQIKPMGGLAFAFFYTTLGIPIARLADTHSRRNIIAICLAVWSGMTAICGLAQNFWQLLLARVGVAVGEAGGSPPAHSMISDLFAADHRATALGIYALGIPVGTMIGNLAGGWINEVMDWRRPSSRRPPGVLLALLLRFTVRSRRAASRRLVADHDRRAACRLRLRRLVAKAPLQASAGAARTRRLRCRTFHPPLFNCVHGMGTGHRHRALLARPQAFSAPRRRVLRRPARRSRRCTSGCRVSRSGLVALLDRRLRGPTIIALVSWRFGISRRLPSADLSLAQLVGIHAAPQPRSSSSSSISSAWGLPLCGHRLRPAQCIHRPAESAPGASERAFNSAVLI